MIIFQGGMFLDEDEKFCGHDQSAIQRLVVCAACGSRVRVFPKLARGVDVVCATDRSHNHFILESEWDKLQREAEGVTPEMVKEALADPIVGPVIRKALSDRNKRGMAALFGESEE